MAMMPGKKPPARKLGSGMVSKPTPVGKKPLPAKPGRVVGKPVPTKPPAKAPGRAGRNPLPPGYTRIKDGKGGFKTIKEKPDTYYLMSKPSVGKATRKPR